MKNNPLPRLDRAPELRQRLLPHCRLQPGQVWEDPVNGHRVGCLDASDSQHCALLSENRAPATLAIHDPPYNMVAFQLEETEKFIEWCRCWVENSHRQMASDSSLYIWLGADHEAGFQPLPEFMLMMRRTPFASRNFITMRNQRGYGTPHNWMWVRQELLYYTLGTPGFLPQYTEIPKTLSGYYKKIDGEYRDNLERGKNPNIRAGNVWFDIQQIFYRMEENVNGCYAQKPLKAINRIIQASSRPGDTVLDYFSHSGTTLLGCEITGRTCLTSDIDPIYCEISIRRLERWRNLGLTGWQNDNPFSTELCN
jgi:site-specific DNA-methyltransferase (adenine-specific)